MRSFLLADLVQTDIYFLSNPGGRSLLFDGVALDFRIASELIFVWTLVIGYHV